MTEKAPKSAKKGKPAKPATPEVSAASEVEKVPEPVTEASPAPVEAAPATPEPNQGEEVSLYEKLGGASAVDAAVDIFYHKVINDARINYFFFGVNVAEQAKKQKAFLTMAFGGPHSYTGLDMRRGHAKLVSMGLNDRHFDIVLDHLRSTLNDLEASEALTNQVIEIAESTREDVLGR